MTLVLLSGGLDSTVLATKLHAVDPGPVEAVSIHYGQRHHRELEAAAAVAHHLGIRHDIIDLTALAPHLAGSALTDPTVPVPEGHYTDHSMTATVVPNRNAIMITVAVGIATARGHHTVTTAVHAGDHPIYPDCRPEFITAIDTATHTATDGTVHVTAPFVHHTKTDIALLGHHLAAPTHLSWSCYQGGPVHCGRCGTCVERSQAFRHAGIPDPTVYADPEFAATVAP